MPEPKFEEAERPESEKPERKAKGNPLQSFLNRKVKIFGKEIPMPLILLAAVGVGLLLFMVMGKRGRIGGETNETQTPDNAPNLGLSEAPSLNGKAEQSAGVSASEFQSDFGSTIAPTGSFEAQPITTPAMSALPVPQLPYGDLGGQFFTPPFLGNEGQQGFYPIQTPNIPSVSQPIRLPSRLGGRLPTASRPGLTGRRVDVRAPVRPTTNVSPRTFMRMPTASRPGLTGRRVDVTRYPQTGIRPRSIQDIRAAYRGQPVRPSVRPTINVRPPVRNIFTYNRPTMPTRTPQRQPTTIRSIFSGTRR